MVKKTKSKKIFILIVLALLVVSGIGFAAKQQFGKKEGSTTASNSKSDGTVGPTTTSEQDKQAAEQAKQNIEERERKFQDKPPGDDRVPVKPIITYAGQYSSQVEVGAYVPGVYEDGGTCTAKFTNGGSTITKSVKAVKNVNNNDCPAMVVKNGEFPAKGKWSVIVSYESSSAAGSSDAKTIEVK